ncbi:MAG: hypothetical protein KDC53_22160, partial [Saprospiraceae bacterium]|nr:hypothetical protein [Saprospiraceae bacterium]
MKKLYLITLILVGYAGMLLSQPVFTIDNTSGDPGGTVSVNFKVSNFTNIVGMQFSINWDPTVLKFSSLSNITNAVQDFDAAAFNTDAKYTDDGSIIVQWYDTGANANFLPDGTIIFTINFDIVGGSGSTTTVSISDSPRKIEIIDNNESNVGLTASGGLFTASGTGSGTTLRMIGSDEMGATGENVCVEVTVQGFTNITGMQLSINWDPAFLTYTGVGAFNLTGLNAGSFNEDDISSGKLRLQWNDPAVAGITLGNNARIFQICFDITGSSGSRSVQFTNDPLDIEIIDSDDQRVTFSKKDGSVTVTGGGGNGSDCDAPGFALAASSESVSAGDQACVDITVKGFTDVTTMSTTIEWDPQVLSNPQINNLNLDGLKEGDFNLDQGANGVLSFVWVEQSTDGLTIADGTRIFEVCFDVITSSGQTSVIFSDKLTDRDVSINSEAATFNQCDGEVTVGNGSNPISASVTQPSCHGETDGAINITVSGGTPGYTYQWTRNGSNFATSEDLTNLQAGTYVVTVTDATGAQFTFEVTLNDPQAIVISNATLMSPTAAGNDGTIALALSGVNPLSFSWSNGATTRDLAGLGGGTYALTITDGNGCTLDTSFALGGGELSVAITTEDISCNGENDGLATATPNGGTPPYQYAWSKSGETGMSISGLGRGNYSVTVTDGAGATATAEGSVAEPDRLTVAVNTTPSPNNVEGTATAVVNGGTAPYRYSWTDANSSTTRVIINLPQGTFRVLVTDDNGCTASGSGNIGG